MIDAGQVAELNFAQLRDRSEEAAPTRVDAEPRKAPYEPRTIVLTYLTDRDARSVKFETGLGTTGRSSEAPKLLVRGHVDVTDVEGVVPEYALAARRYLGDEGATAFLAQIERPETRIHRIGLRPSWVGMHDFKTRLPRVLGGIQEDPPPKR